MEVPNAITARGIFNYPSGDIISPWQAHERREGSTINNRKHELTLHIALKKDGAVTGTTTMTKVRKLGFPGPGITLPGRKKPYPCIETRTRTYHWTGKVKSLDATTGKFKLGNLTYFIEDQIDIAENPEGGASPTARNKASAKWREIVKRELDKQAQARTNEAVRRKSHKYPFEYSSFTHRKRSWTLNASGNTTTGEIKFHGYGSGVLKIEP